MRKVFLFTTVRRDRKYDFSFSSLLLGGIGDAEGMGGFR